MDVSGDASKRDVTVAFRRADGRTLAVATIYRDVESLKAEVAMEMGDEKSLALLGR
jgi:hypothetical protein